MSWPKTDFLWVVEERTFWGGHLLGFGKHWVTIFHHFCDIFIDQTTNWFLNNIIVMFQYIYIYFFHGVKKQRDCLCTERSEVRGRLVRSSIRDCLRSCGLFILEDGLSFRGMLFDSRFWFAKFDLVHQKSLIARLCSLTESAAADVTGFLWISWISFCLWGFRRTGAGCIIIHFSRSSPRPYNW